MKGGWKVEGGGCSRTDSKDGSTLLGTTELAEGEKDATEQEQRRSDMQRGRGEEWASERQSRSETESESGVRVE